MKKIKIVFKNGAILEIQKDYLPDYSLTMRGHCEDILKHIKTKDDYSKNYLFLRADEIVSVKLI